MSPRHPLKHKRLGGGTQTRRLFKRARRFDRPVERAAGMSEQEIEVVGAATLRDGLFRLANRLLVTSGAE